MLAGETKQSPYIGYIKPQIWQEFSDVFIANHKGVLIGACVIVPLSGWVKIGPFIVMSSYQGKGVGKRLLTHVTTYFKNTNVYIGSSNPKVIQMASNLRFQNIGFVKLPREVKLYLISYLLQRASWEYIVDALRKKLTSKRFVYKYFIKPKNFKL